MNETQRAAAEYVQRLRDDVHFFADEIWHGLGLDKKAPLSEVEHDMIEWLAHGPQRRGILALRGIGKTTLACVVIAWRLFRNKERKVLATNKHDGAGEDTIGLVRAWLDKVYFLSTLAPNKRAGELDNQGEFNLAGVQPSRQPSLRAVGILGSLPGNRAMTILVDDIEDKTNTKTPESRFDLADRCGEFDSILYLEAPDVDRGPYDDPNEIIETGTYHHEDSVYVKEAAAGVVFRVYPIVYPTPAEREAMRHTFRNPVTGEDEVRIDLAPILADRLDRGLVQPGDIVLPHRITPEDVAKKRARGKRYWYLQQMLILRMGDEKEYPLQLKDIMVLDLDPKAGPTEVRYDSMGADGLTDINDFPCVGFDNDRFRRPAWVDPTPRPYLGTKMWIDSAGKGKDMTGLAVVSYLNGRLFVQRCEGLPGGYETAALQKLAQIARETRTREVYVESNFGGGMFAALLLPVLKAHFVKPCEEYPEGWTCAIVDDTKITHATGMKDARIIADLEPVFSTHRAIFDRRVAMNRELQHQITHITRQKDSLTEYGAIDALSGCFRAWQYALNVDPEQKARRQREDDEDRLDREIFERTPRWLREDRRPRRKVPNWMAGR